MADRRSHLIIKVSGSHHLQTMNINAVKTQKGRYLDFVQNSNLKKTRHQTLPFLLLLQLLFYFYFITIYDKVVNCHHLVY